jgi:hypothetical protein
MVHSSVLSQHHHLLLQQHTSEVIHTSRTVQLIAQRHTLSLHDSALTLVRANSACCKELLQLYADLSRHAKMQQQLNNELQSNAEPLLLLLRLTNCSGRMLLLSKQHAQLLLPVVQCSSCSKY